jgi:hypothetical protein
MAKKTFAEWMAAVDAALLKKCGMDSRDLADICYSDLYEDGGTPGGAATKAIKASGGGDW